MATAATAKAATTSGLPRATRQPSAFHPTVRCTVLVHSSVDSPVTGSLNAIKDLFEQEYGDAYAVRAVSRTRNTGKAHTGPATLAVYIAPQGYEFAKASVERGVRLDADTANLLRSVAAKMGLDPSDPASIMAVAQALAKKAQ